ncbi:MAG: RDD family protein, partial [Thermoleophilaceae bacterium]
MQVEMNAIAHSSSAPVSGPKLDNRRMLAALIDLAIAGAGAAAVLVAAGTLGGSDLALGGPVAAVAVGWALYYYFACETGGGQTVGKRLMKIRVVRLDGTPPGIREVALRSVLRVVDSALVGLVVMLATGDRRGRLGDLVARTKVVAADGPTVEPAASAPAAPAVSPAEAPVVAAVVEAPVVEA